MGQKELNEIEPPLLRAFQELMALESGQPHRGVDFTSYLLLIETLKAGYGFLSKEDLIFICKKLWLKPFHRNNSVLNEDVLRQVIERNLSSIESIASIQPVKEIPKAPESITPNDKPIESAKEIPKSINDQEETQRKIDRIETVTSTLSLLLADYVNEGAAQAGEQDKHSTLFNSKSYILNKKYLPVSQRFIEQTIRSLRFRSKGAGKAVIDVAATVEAVAKKGYIVDWKKTEEDGFVTNWTLMIDVGGSMAPFQDLCEAIVNAVKNSSMKNEGDVFYFKNTATKNLFLNPALTRAIPFSRLSDGRFRHILIISDAGAARGNYKEERVSKAHNMIYRLRRHRVAWLNPMPVARWKDTSAEEIATFVNMFEPGNENGDSLGNIVHVLKAKKIS